MALIGNRSVLLKSPGRFLSGTVAAGERSNFNGRGKVNNSFQAFSRFAAMPNGHAAPSAWSLPRRAGYMSSVNFAGLTLTTTAAGSMGLPAEGSTSITFAADATGQLIASGNGTASLTFAATGAAVATLTGIGSASMVFGASASIGAEASVSGAASFAFTAAVTPYAIGTMQGSTENAQALTPSAISSAVWERVIEAGFTAEQLIRVMTSYAAGAATGLEGANPQFIGLDGETVRIDGNYSAGTRTINEINGA